MALQIEKKTSSLPKEERTFFFYTVYYKAFLEDDKEVITSTSIKCNSIAECHRKRENLALLGIKIEYAYIYECVYEDYYLEWNVENNQIMEGLNEIQNSL